MYGRTIGLPFLSFGPSSATALTRRQPATGSNVLRKRDEVEVRAKPERSENYPAPSGSSKVNLTGQ